MLEDFRRIVVTVEYDGTDFCGWQIQPNGISVQQRLEEAVKSLTGETVNAAASGRTDAGVHAIAQTVHFDTHSKIPVANFVPGLNRYLPGGISVKSAREADGSFHARFSARSKTYIYKVYMSGTPSPLHNRTHYVFPYDLFIKPMRTAALQLVGTHDFKSFCSSGSSVSETVRTIYSLDIEQNGSELLFTVTGNGFLYNMVRIIVALLLDVGQGRVHEREVTALLDACDRTKISGCAPACGLYLKEVKY